MAQIETWLKTDLKQIVRVQELDGQLFTADNQANLIGVIVTDKGTPVTLSGAVTGYVIRSDGETVIVTGSTSMNKAYIILPASAYVKAGPVHIVIKVGLTTVCACTGYIGQSFTDTIVDPGHTIPSLEELLAQIENCRTATTNANNAAGAANSAAGSANTAASNANSKASAANAAATNATNAASAANTAATNANNKASAANDAAALANTKAALADEKAALANTKANLANEKATLADQKATAANDAAALANTKAALADEKATLADQKATAANNAAAAANAAAESIDDMTVAASGLSAGASPTVDVSDVSGHKHIAFGIPKGDKGDPGKDFHIQKTFVSIAAMQAYDPDEDQSSHKVHENEFVMIDTGSVQDADTGKLFCYEPETQEVWRYIGDLSGSQGIRGETGTGIANIVLNQDYTLTITMDDGTTSYTTPSIRGAQGEQGIQGDPGDPTELIDDTAGDSATDKVWSANKLFNEIGKVVRVQDTQPSDAINKVWIMETPPDGVQVPTMQDFNAGLETRAPAIIVSSEQKNTFGADELSSLDDFNIICDATDHTHIAYAKGEDIFPITDSSIGDFFTKAEENTATIDGTIESSTYLYSRVNDNAKYAPMKEIKNGDTVKVCAFVEGTFASGTQGQLEVHFLNSSDEKIKTLYCVFNGSNDFITTEWEMTEDVANIRVYIKMYAGTYSNIKVSWSGTIGSAFTKVDGGSELSFSKEFIGNDGFSIIPQKAYVKYVADTKTYIDQSTPDDMLTKDDLVYLSPEMYGAKGNGSGDDTQAIQACINAAITAGKPVRGYGTYKTSSTIVIDGNENEYFFHRINYSGNGYAVQISGRWNTFGFHYISALSTGGKGISFISSPTDGNCERIKINGNAIYSNLQCVNINASEDRYILYIVFDVKAMFSAAGDCIVGETERESEISVYNTWFSCVSGWCYNGNYIKLFNCSMESNCYGGVYSWMATIQNCRARELMDCLMHGNAHYNDRSGILYKAKASKMSAKVLIQLDDVVYYDAIDLSEVVVNNTGTGQASVDNAFCGRVRSDICFGDLNYNNGHFMIGKEMVLHGNDRICVPKYRNTVTVTSADYDLRDIARDTWNAYRPIYSTKFVIDVADCVIHLSPSYCAEGYSEFIVDMTNYMATIYDRRGNVLFNPANYDAGVYKFTATIDPSIDDTYQYEDFPINSGYCDVWDIEKLPSITQVSGDVYQVEM